MTWPAATLVALALGTSTGAPLFTTADTTGAGGPASMTHPAIVFLDSLDAPIANSNGVVSTMRTCGRCHDTEYIAANNYHVQAGEGARNVGNPSRGGELNCFLCHLPVSLYDPQNARADIPFDADSPPIVAPSAAHCGRCHGLVRPAGTGAVDPRYGRSERSTDLTGLVFSPQRIHLSAMNVAGKDTLTRPWDVHAERLLDCTGCHYSLNDPSHATAPGQRRPAHLDYDSRRQDVGEFLRRPSHHFAKGYSVQGTVADELDGTMRRCEDCHDARSTHTWLPYTERHLARLLCETCHIPRVVAPARRVTDRTVITPDGGPRLEYRGTPGAPTDPTVLVEGYRPLLIPRAGGGEPPRLGPVNVVASWYWVSDETGDEVSTEDLRRSFFDGGRYHPDIVTAFDRNGDGSLTADELVIDSGTKNEAVRARLERSGVRSPRIAARLEPFGLHHGVVAGKWATRDCATCHAAASSLSAPFTLAKVVPGGVVPEIPADVNVSFGGDMIVDGTGALCFVPDSSEDGFYILGHDRWGGGDVAGIAIIVAVLLGVITHGGMRYRYARARGTGGTR